MIGCTPASMQRRETSTAPNRLPVSVTATAGIRYLRHSAARAATLIAPSDRENAV